MSAENEKKVKLYLYKKKGEKSVYTGTVVEFPLSTTAGEIEQYIDNLSKAKGKTFFFKSNLPKENQ